ncbi:MAG: hypothetical protein BRC37_16645 [Cyanobacteria bacterium QH_3_48_40]|nr:MAG: hypothetical protein BRC37_16645 [Cyanobacteria bacterium QH_3_48_40]
MEATTPAYPTRLSDTQWAVLAVYFATDSQLGRPRNTNLRAVVEAILYILRAGCPWLAHAAVGLSALADRLWLLPILALQRQLEAHSPLPTRVGCGSRASQGYFILSGRIRMLG